MEIAHYLELIRAEIRSSHAYEVPPATGMVKLDAMENPYTWPEELRQRWFDVLATVDVNRYPDAAAADLTDKIKQHFSVPDSVGVLLGNGSDELIQLLAMGVNKPGAVLMAPEPSFVMYKMAARFVGMSYQGFSLTDDFNIDLSAAMRSIKINKPAIIFLAYPNNPTSNCFDEASIETIIKDSGALVVVDEAYVPYSDKSFLAKLDTYPNLLVLKTFSKMGLAGLRLGILMGHQSLINSFNSIRMPYNINTLTQVTAAFALENKVFFNECVAKVKQNRERLLKQLQQLPGLHVFVTDANFVVVRFEKLSATKAYEFLKAQKILVKNLDQTHSLLSNCLRITVGTPEENDQLVSTLSQFLS